MEILEIKSFEEYSNFILELADNPSYYDPHFAYDKDNLYGALKRKDEYSFAVLENGVIKGIFVWLIIPDEKYIELLIGFTKSKKAFIEMLLHMENKYQGYELALLVKAIELNRPHQMMVLVDVDALKDIEIYTAAGFKKAEGQNSIYATYKF